MKPIISLSALTAVLIGLTACNEKPADPGKASADSGAAASGYPGSEAGAKDLLSAFLKVDADRKTLTAALRPDKADYEAVFAGDLAAKVQAAHAPMWDGGAAIGPNEGQTEILLHSVPSADIKTWTMNASDNLPGGYERIKDQIRDGLTIYAFTLVKPGETLGMAFDGLVHVNGSWRLFPKPWRAAE